MLYYIFIALLPAIFDGLGNIIDSSLSRSLRLNGVIFYGTLLNFLFVPLIFFFGLPCAPTWEILLMVTLGWVVQVLYLYPYTVALTHIDTSIVAALFSLGKLLIPISAFFIVWEVLPAEMYVGFFIVIFSSILLSITRIGGKFQINRAFTYMLLCSVILALNNVVTKYVLKIDLDWISYFFWSQCVSVVLILVLLLIPKYRKDIVKDAPVFKENLWQFVLQSFFAIGGIVTAIFALSVAPVTFVTGVESVQPLLVLGFSFLIHRFYPNFLYEGMWKEAIIKKTGLFICIFLWVALMTSGFRT